MLEILPIKVETVVDLSLIIAILSGVAVYFGKLINEVSWKKEEKYAYYVHGSVFLVLFVIFPPLVLYTIFENVFISINLYLALTIQFLIAWYLGKRLKVYSVMRVKLGDFVKKLTQEKTKKVYQKIKFLKKPENARFPERVFDWFYLKRLPDWLLWLFALLNYWFTAIVIYSKAKPILIFMSILFLFVSISVIAILNSWNSVKFYPVVNVHLEDGSILKGELTKIDAGFVNLLDGNKIYHITDSKVRYIEKEILTEKGKKYLKDKILK